MSIYDVESGEALKGLKALDLGQSAVAQLMLKYLGDHGATAIYIESRTHVDITRSSSPYFGGVVNPNRAANASITLTSRFGFGLNIRQPEGAEIARRLCSWADVIISSYPRGVMERHGLGHQDLRKLNPAAVVVTCSALGSSGPYAEYRGFGWAQKALLGVIEYTGWPDRPGVGVPQAYSDYSTPWIGTAAVMAALEQRRTTGKGAHIELSHLEASSAFVPSHLLLQYTANKGIPRRQGNRTPEAAPCGAYPCQGEDRWCTISVHGDEEWQALAKVVGLAWTRDARFATHDGRKAHEDELDALVASFTANHRPHQLMVELQGAGVRAGVVQNYAEILEQDPQTKHRGFFARLSRPELENISHPGWPAKLSRTPAVLRPTPRVGEHTYAICKEVLNMPDEEFVRLLNAGVLEVST